MFLNNFTSVLLVHLIFLVGLCAQPSHLTDYLKVKDSFVRASFGAVHPPKDILPFATKIRSAAVEDPEWFKEHAKGRDPSEPLSYHQKLGLSKEEYDQYIKLWNQRQFKPIKKVDLRLEKRDDGTWMIRATGVGFPIQSLIFTEDGDKVTSQNGVLTRKADINDNANSLLGEWSGKSWELESKGVISTTLESFAIGKIKDQNAGYLIYRLQEVSPSGRRTYDNQILLKLPVNP